MYFQTMGSQTWEAIFDQEESKMDERLQKQLAFALEIDKEKNILRQTHLSGHGRRENDAEHACVWIFITILYG